MDENEDPLELERKIAQASRISSRITDQTTYERLRAWAEELRQRLGQRLAARRTRKRLERAPTNSGNRMDGQQTATWSSGFRPSPRSASAIRSNQCLRFGGSDVCLNVSMCRSSCHSSMSRPSTSCSASLMASASSSHRSSTRFWI